FFTLLVVAICVADTPTATLSGTVYDSSGGVMAGVTVMVRNIATGVARTTSTNQAGAYQMLGLQSGQYQLSASQPRFSTVERGDITLQVGADVRIDVTLSPGPARETLVITEAAPLVQRESGTAATVVNERAIQDLPTDGRQ